MSNFESLVYALHSLSQLQVISISQHCKVRDYDKEILTMILDKVKNIKSGRLLRRIISSNYLTRKAAQYLYRKYYSLRKKREFASRINKIDPDKYLDTSHKPKLNVIILVIDSLQNSRLSCQGYFRETTPFLDSLKSRFTAISASPWTYPSVASTLTGLYPPNHNAVLAGRLKDQRKFESYRSLKGDVLTLPGMLFLLGYRIYFGTAIDLAFYPLRARVVLEGYKPLARADDLLNNLTKWISKKRERFFAYVQIVQLQL